MFQNVSWGRGTILKLWHRFYDPSTGRYITADPIGLAGGMNLYSYVGGDPVNAIDPWGLRVVSIELNLFGYGLGFFVDTGVSGTVIFEGIHDIGVFSDHPTGGFEDFDFADLGKKLKAGLLLTHAQDRCSFDADTDRFNANLLFATMSTDLKRSTLGIGLHIPLPITEVENRTVKATSVLDVGRDIKRLSHKFKRFLFE